MTHETRKYCDKNLIRIFFGLIPDQIKATPTGLTGQKVLALILSTTKQNLSQIHTHTQQLQHLVPSTVSFLHLFKNINVLAVDFLVSKDKQVAVGPSW